MKNKNIVVVYYGNDWKRKFPLPKAESTRKSFEDWHKRGLKYGINFFRASIRWFDLKRNVFMKAWAYRQGRWIKIEKEITPDLIFDKIAGKRDHELFELKNKISQKVKIFNNPLFRITIDSKFSQYLLFSDFMPQSFLIFNKIELKKKLTNIKSTKAVIKPLYGSGGKGIIIDKKSNILKKRNRIKYPTLIQEFIISRKGIPGFSQKNEIADLRMVFINHKLIYSLSRIAKKGSLFTNFHQGATAVLVPKKKIPASAVQIANKIIQKLKVFPEAHYSLDFIFTNSGKPILVEMNTTPGFDLLYIIGDEKIKEQNLKEFLSILN